MSVTLIVGSLICGFVGLLIGLRYQRRWDALRLLSESIPQLVYVGDAEGRGIYLNKQWSRYTGNPVSKLQGHVWRSLIHPDDIEGMLAHRAETKRLGQEFEYRARLRRHDGVYRWFVVKSYPHRERNGRITRWFGTYTDIHDQVLAQKEMSEAKSKLELVLASSNIGIWEIDFSTGIVTRSEQHDRVYGHPGNLPVWTWNHFMDAIHPDDRKGVREHIDRVNRSKDDSYAGEFRIVWPDGSVHWIASRAQFIRDASGTTTHVRGLIWDVSDVKVAQEEAEAAARAKSQFLANVSHELRTPLGAILGFQKMLRDPSLPESERETYNAIVERNGQALLRLIDDVLDLSKVEAGALGIEVGPIALKGEVESIVSAFEPQLKSTGNRLELHFDPTSPSAIVSDPLRFRQIITNLLSNALKFTHHGSIRLEVRPEGDLLVFDVIDSGAGIASSVRGSLFRPFRQGDETITRRYGGTGLGLALSRELARALGGDVLLVDSEIGRGSRFRLQLPLVEGINVTPLDDARPTRPQRTRSLEGYRILVVDDSPDNQLLMKRALQRVGAVVELAANGLEGIDRANAGDFDVILMDMQMPVMDGATATKQLRSEGYAKPIFALTAHAMKEQRDASLKSGCDEHVSKPVDFGALSDLIIEKVPLRTDDPFRGEISRSSPATHISPEI